jgi:hypothetical protein
MGEGVRGIYRTKKQRTSGPRGVRSLTITHRSKGCLICLGIIQQSIQKVAYVCVLFIEYDILSISVHLVVLPRTSTLKIRTYIWWPSLHPLL